MPPYSGTQFKILLRPRRPNASVQLITVNARDWESSVEETLPQYPSQEILGRIRNLDVELFAHYPQLRRELESMGYTVRGLDKSKIMSVYLDTEVKDRSLVQKLQDQLYQALWEEKLEIAYGLIAATQSECMLVCKLDRERFNAHNPCPPVLTSMEVEYETIGYILDNDIHMIAAEKVVKKFLLDKEPWVLYKFVDMTDEAENERQMKQEKEERVREHKREKRRAKKQAAKKAGKEQNGH